MSHPRLLVPAQSNTLCIAVTPSRPIGATSPPVMMAKSIPECTASFCSTTHQERLHKLPSNQNHSSVCVRVTLAKSVFPVPGGPYIRMFRYRPRFCLVFLVAMAMSRTRSSRVGCADADHRFHKLTRTYV